MIVLRAIVLEPDDVAVAAIALVDGPWTREGVVDDGDDVVHDVRVGLVERDRLLDDGLIVLVQRDAAEFDRAWTLEVAGLDLERVEAAVAVGVRPFADRIAGEARLGVLGEIASVGIDATRHEGFEVDIGDVWQNDEFDRLDHRHHARHAIGDAGVASVQSLTAGRLVSHAPLQSLQIFGLERGLLAQASRLVLVPLGRKPAWPAPLPRPVWIFRFIMRGGIRHRQSQRGKQRNSGYRTLGHLDLPGSVSFPAQDKALRTPVEGGRGTG